MDCLHSSLSAADQQEAFKVLSGVYPLSISSGNAQGVVANSKDGIENQYPLPPDQQDLRQQFPIPPKPLGSNDSFHHPFDKKVKRNPLKPYRPKNEIDPDRPYLRHPKYLEYRSRPRQDIGRDGKPIWPDKIEAAFQNALVHIKPMGRKKCSQRGKPYGRNMLIAEWIFRETGEERKRKQVSSHIQVLDRFLSGIPEWDRLIKPGDDDDDGPSEGHKFYHNSIEHMVNEQKARGQDATEGDDDDSWEGDIDGDHSLLSSGTMSGSLEAHNVKDLSFEMWVSLPDDYDHALHNYTRLRPAKLMPMPLEDLMGWRHSYPHLEAGIDQDGRSSRCEVILLNTSFSLMEDFPPRHSKLCIGLELEVPAPKWLKVSRKGEAKHWTCVTYTYRDGVLISEPSREDRRISGKGNVKPFFQSRWWASTFTSLTEAKKVAEDSKDPAAIAIAREQSLDFFRNLTIMQEISIAWCDPKESANKGAHKSSRSTLALLWKFSQETSGSTGTTTWQTLITPPDRFATNSPYPSASEIELPPLNLDSLVDCSPGVGSFDGNNHFLSQTALAYNLYPEEMDEELCQDGFMAMKTGQLPQFGHPQPSFDLQPTQSFISEHGLDSLHQAFGVSQNNLGSAVDDDSSSGLPGGSIFEGSRTLKRKKSLPNMQTDLNGLVKDAQRSTNNLQNHPLTRFNVKTHQVLQEQLGTQEDDRSASLLDAPHGRSAPSRPTEMLDAQHWGSMDQVNPMLQELIRSQHEEKSHKQTWNHIDEDDEALRTALLAASAINDLGAHPPQTPRSHHHHHHHPHEFGGPSDDQHHDDPHWVSPLAFRPVLHTHHSFPGMGSPESVPVPAQLQLSSHSHAGHHPGAVFEQHGHHGNDHDAGAHDIPMPRSAPLHHTQLSDPSSTTTDAFHASLGLRAADPRAMLSRAHSEPDPLPIAGGITTTVAAATAAAHSSTYATAGGTMTDPALVGIQGQSQAQSRGGVGNEDGDIDLTGGFVDDDVMHDIQQ